MGKTLVGTNAFQVCVCMREYLMIYIYHYHGKCGISLWVIGYIPGFELAVKHLGINH